MIEIPDLDELSPYQDILDQYHAQKSQQSHHIRNISDITGNYPTDSRMEQAELSESPEGLYQLDDQLDRHENEQGYSMPKSGLQIKHYDSLGATNTDRPLIKEPPINLSVNDTSFGPGLSSITSLPLSEDSHDINAQVLEYSTAEPLFMNQVNMTEAATGDAPRVHVVEQHGPENENFKLQDPPVIHGKHIPKDQVIEEPQEIRSIQKEESVKSNLSLSQQLASPMSQFPIHDYTKESPQLPPPLSTLANKRLTLSNGEEFGYIRREMATYLKTPAEYTLHIIFTQFVRHAERKLNLCLEYPLMDEPPVVDILAEGVDPQFDKIVSSLGYIARRKPKPVIDSVMFWRKSKSEVASMASSEVEKILSAAKMTLSKTSQNENISSANPGINKNNTANKAKRSLSLMRTKSISKMTGHSRTQSASSSTSSNTLKSPSLVQNLLETGYMKQKSMYDDQINQAREIAIQADRKSLALIYILCRVLIEVVKQASPEVMGNDLGDKLEEIVFTQLKTTDPVSKSESLVRSSNWNLFAELLGYMSEKRFLSVSDRFIANLEKVPVKIRHEDEPKLSLLIHGMSYLKLTNYPLETFEESAEFVQSLAKFFDKSTNETIIFAYCEVLSKLLLPLASILTAETNHPTWVEAIEKIYNKAFVIWKNVNKTVNSNLMLRVSNGSQNVIDFNNSWAYSIHLMTSALSVSRRELFSDSWFEVIENNAFKLKPKVETSDKSTFIICITRLAWVYTYRLNDTLNNTIKRLDALFNMLFFGSNATGKKNQWLVPDSSLINPLVELIRVIGFQHLNYVLDNVLIKLLKLSFNGTSLENSYPEKIIVAVQSYLTILEDYEVGDKPKFPTDDIFNLLPYERSHNSSNLNSSQKSRRNKFKSNEIMFIAKNSTNAFSHEEISRMLAVLLKLLDTNYGSDIWSANNSVYTPLSSSSKSQAAFSGFHFGLDFSYLQSKDLHIELFASILEAIPWTLVPLSGEKVSSCGIPFKNVVEILTRNAVHSNPIVSRAAINSLKKLASKKNPNSLITIFAKFAFQFNDKPGSTYNSDYLNSTESHKLLKVYVELLSRWLKQFSEINGDSNDGNSANPLAQDDELMNKDVLNDLYQINYKPDDLATAPDASKTKRSDELEWKTIITLIEEIEGNGLFFLCSQDPQTRHYGISILKLVEQFDQAIYNMTDTVSKQSDISNTAKPNIGAKGHSRSSSKFAADVGTRLIHVLESTDFMGLIKPFKDELSIPERSRLTKLKNKKNILIKLAESDYGIDSTLWFRLFPKLLDIFFEKCPMPVAMCRSIVCVRMVQMYEFVYEFSESYKNYTSSLFGKSNSNIPPEVLVNQWRLYLIFACCSLTSTNEQKISFPSQPTHGRKKSMQMFIQHQKITSAKSVFRMVIPFLRSQQPMVRDAVISGLSCININIFKTLLENLPESLNNWDMNMKGRDAAEDRLRIEIIHILCNIATRFKSDSFIYTDEAIIANLVAIIKNVKAFLSVPLVQTDVEFQRLRRYFSSFLENVFLGIQINSDLNKWLPFEARIGCFNFLKEWCGVGESVEITEDRYSTMIKRVKQQKEATSTVAILEVERKALQFASLSCMAVLCSGPIKQKIEVVGKIAVMSFDIPDLMSWTHALICSDNEKINEMGELALKNILQLNLNNEEIYRLVLKQCYSPQPSAKASKSIFSIFIDMILKIKQFEEIPFDIICLSTVMIGHSDYEIRCTAMKLLVYLEEKFYDSSTVNEFSEYVRSKSKRVYQKALVDISTHLASLHPESAHIRISYLTMFVASVDDSLKRNILTCLQSWVLTINLEYTEDRTDTQDLTFKSKTPMKKLNNVSVMVLTNLIEITVKYSLAILDVEPLWVAIGTVNNFDKVLDFLMDYCLERKNPLMVKYSSQIIDYLTFCQPNPISIIDKFIDNLQPKAMIPPNITSNYLNPVVSQEFPYISNLLDAIPATEKNAVFSPGQLSMVFLVDIFTIQNDRMIERLPLLLHVAFSLLDHYLNVVQELAGSLLIYLIHTLAPSEPKSSETIEVLRQRDNFKNLWVYDDLNNDKKGARTPKNMDLLARNVLEIFTPVVPSLQDDWSRVSLHWATTCAVRHIACRSFQLFRSLLSFLDQGMLRDMLHRLSNTISDETLDIQGFAMQILMTLNAITAELDSEKLIDFPQLFWSSVACLSTVHEQEFVEVLSTMSKFVSKIDLDAPDTVSCLISTFPPKWEGKFEGLQQIVMVGLRSATAWEPSMKFLDKLNYLKDSEIIGTGDSRLLMSVLANLPRFLHALDQKMITKEIEETASVLSKMSDNCNKSALSRVLVSLSKNRFRSKKDFLVQTLSCINSTFFPEYEAQTLVLLLGFLSNKTPWIKLETMNLLKHIFPLVDLERDEFVGVGADLISPLLRLLLTDYAEPALEVLDEAVIISGSQLDKDVLRMSLSNSSMKKEYEKTATLFGIPDDSGWAIPMPVVTAASTRNNVHAIFSTCTETTYVDNNAEESDHEEDIQFHMEDYYAPVVDYGDTASVSVEEPDASLSNMWAALDDFDSFFTKDTEQNGSVTVSNNHIVGRRDAYNHHIHSASVDTKYSNSSDPAFMDSVPQVYDNKASLILNRSLARTKSNTSFKNNLADSMGASEHASPGAATIQKKSYIPFRHGKHSVKSKNDAFTTPNMGNSAVFDHDYRLSPLRSPSASNSSLSYYESESPPHPGRNLDTTITSPIISEGSTRFENLVGSNKKKVKKANRFSPNSTNNINTSPNVSHHYWSNKHNSLSPNLHTPPISAQKGQAYIQKPKEKRKKAT